MKRISRNIIIHDHLLNTINIVFGYLWLISGLDKAFGNKFVSGFSDYVLDQLKNPAVYGWYKNILTSSVILFQKFEFMSY